MSNLNERVQPLWELPAKLRALEDRSEIYLPMPPRIIDSTEKENVPFCHVEVGRGFL